MNMKSYLFLFIHFGVQVREAIGVAMSITCSNVRLSGSFGPSCSSGELCGDVSMTEQTGNEYWSKRLTDGATELSVRIQNNIQSKQLELASDLGTENGLDNKDDADAKRMETVLISYLFSGSKSVLFHFLFQAYAFLLQIFHFMIASLKSGRSSVLLDVIIGLFYPVLSLQVYNIVTLPWLL
jgi:proteasome activator subunit 4